MNILLIILTLWIICGLSALWVKTSNPFNEVVKIFFLNELDPQDINGFKVIGLWTLMLLKACLLGPSLLIEAVYEK